LYYFCDDNINYQGKVIYTKTQSNKHWISLASVCYCNPKMSKCFTTVCPTICRARTRNKAIKISTVLPKSGCLGSLIVDLDIRWRWELSFTLWLLYHKSKHPQVGPRANRSDVMAKRKVPALPGIESWCSHLQRVSLLTDLLWLILKWISFSISEVYCSYKNAVKVGNNSPNNKNPPICVLL
jgi:hypothetical protein